MGAGKGSAPWLELGDVAHDNGDQAGCGPEEHGSTLASFQALSDWTLLFAFTAMMSIPFVLVAWLMS